MAHELDNLDRYLGVEIGTSYLVLVKHQNPIQLNAKLESQGIALDEFGMVPKSQHNAWKTLMQLAGVSSRYWKDKDLLLPEAIVTNLEAM